MKTISANIDSEALHWEPKCPFDLVIAYEDTHTRNRALQLYDRVAQQLLDDYDFQCSWWKFDHLQSQPLMTQALDAAVEAHMVIVSVRGGKDLHPVAKRWLEAWCPNKASHKSALVALVEVPNESAQATSHIHAYLQQIARRAGMDFFIHRVELVEEEYRRATEPITERAQVVTPFLKNILHLPASPVLRAD